jgi:hypothetical protein
MVLKSLTNTHGKTNKDLAEVEDRETSGWSVCLLKLLRLNKGPLPGQQKLLYKEKRMILFCRFLKEKNSKK